MTVPDIISAVIAVLVALSFMALRARRRGRRPHPDGAGPRLGKARPDDGDTRSPRSDDDQRRAPPGDPRGTAK